MTDFPTLSIIYFNREINTPLIYIVTKTIKKAKLQRLQEDS